MRNVVQLPSKYPATDQIVKEACKSFNAEMLPSIPLLAIECVYPRCNSLCKFGKIAQHIMRAMMPEQQPKEDQEALKKVLESRLKSYDILIVPGDLRKIYQARRIWRELWRKD